MGEAYSGMEKTMKKTRKMGIKKKLLSAVIPLVLMSIILLSAVCYVVCRHEVVKGAKETLLQENSLNASEISGWTNGILTSLDSIKGTMEHMNNKSDAELLAYMETTPDLHDAFPSGIYGGYADGVYMDGSGWVPGDDWVITERSWFKEGKTFDEFTFGEPYMDAETGTYVVSVSTHFDRTGKEFVAATDVYLDGMSEQVSEIVVCETGYAFLVNTTNNTILAHKDSANQAKVISPEDEDGIFAAAAKAIEEKNYGLITADSDNGSYFLSVGPVENTEWVMVSCVKEADILKDLDLLLYLCIGVAAVVIAITAIVVERMVHAIISPLHGLTKVLGEITAGNFAVDVVVKGTDEISEMSGALDAFIKEMRGTLKGIHDISVQLKEKSENSQVVSQNLKDTSENQADAMFQLNTTVEELARAVTELAEHASSLADVVSDTTENGNQANGQIQEMVQITDTGHKDMLRLRSDMEKIVQAIDELGGAVQDVSASTEQINSIVNMIAEIAEQTNLLALNAAIEAARAGESGRGFAVVASEIGSLAESSAESATQISEIILGISNQVVAMTKKTEESIESIQENSGSVENACDTFEVIYERVNHASGLIGEMVGQMKHVDDVATAMAAIAEEQSAATEEILATAETVSNSSQALADDSKDVSESARTVADASETLVSYVDKFTI